MSDWSSDDFRDSLQSMEATWGNVTLRAIQSMKVSDKLRRDRVYGNGPGAIGLPKGTHEADGELVTIPAEFENVVQALGNEYTQVRGSIGVTLRRPDGTFYTVTLTRVYLNEVNLEFGKAGGSDPSLVTLPFYVLDPIDFNGLKGIETQSLFSFSVDLFSLLGL